jgi:hypothetical protein
VKYVPKLIRKESLSRLNAKHQGRKATNNWSQWKRRDLDPDDRAEFSKYSRNPNDNRQNEILTRWLRIQKKTIGSYSEIKKQNNRFSNYGSRCWCCPGCWSFRFGSIFQGQKSP